MNARRVPLLALALVLAGCTSGEPGANDTDRDGVSDELESTGWTIVVMRQDGNVTRDVTSNVNRPDSDGDRLEDDDEYEAGTDPHEVDTDGDGLLDGPSMRVSDPDLLAAFREWGIVETAPGVFAGEAESCGGVEKANPAKWDSDRPYADGLSDGDEARGWNVTVGGRTTRVAANPCLTDTDADGWPDAMEREAASDPTKKDTDGDAVWDAVDGDPLADIAVRVSVERVTLAREPPAGAKFRVTMSLAGAEERITRDAAPGANALAATRAANVDDTTDTRHASLPVQVVIVVALVDADGRATPLNLTGGDPVMAFTFDVLRNVARLGEDAPRAGALETTGPDGTARFTFTRETA